MRTTIRTTIGSVLLLCSLVCEWAGAAELATPKQFTDDFAAAIRLQGEGWTANIKETFEIAAKGPDGQELTFFLDNAYNMYRMKPAEKELVIQQYLGGMIEAHQTTEKIDKERIVPVVKDRRWMAETDRAIKARGEKDGLTYVHEEINQDLVVLYAEDSPRSIKFLSSDHLKELNLQLADLKPLAINNLKRLLPELKVEVHGPIISIVADGNYETSLLLSDKMWGSNALKVEGEIVLSVPARGSLLVVGSAKKEDVAMLRRITRNIHDESPYRLTTQLFVYRNGRFERY